MSIRSRNRAMAIKRAASLLTANRVVRAAIISSKATASDGSAAPYRCAAVRWRGVPVGVVTATVRRDGGAFYGLTKRESLVPGPAEAVLKSMLRMCECVVLLR